MRRRQLFQQLEYTHVTHEDILVSVHDIILFLIHSGTSSPCSF